RDALSRTAWVCPPSLIASARNVIRRHTSWTRVADGALRRNRVCLNSYHRSYQFPESRGACMSTPPPYVSSEACEAALSHGDIIDQIRKVLAWDAAGTIQWPEPRNLNIAPDRWGND